MKFHQAFDVNQDIAKVWSFFEQPVRVTECIPGVDSVEVLDADTLSVRVTQTLGPLSATFESKVHITERVHEERITFTSTGKAVRGAIGHFRASNTVFLEPQDGRTHVKVAGDAALAGALGSVGQKIIMKQADKITVAFARNLEAALSGVPQGERPPAKRAAALQIKPAPVAAGLVAVGPAGQNWSKASAILSGLAVLIGLLILFGVHL
jgi:carbon monoxide dehydrogenase subunit G